MGKVFEGISDRMETWIAKQPMFFVATAPLAAEGIINCSPKGLTDSLAILDEHTVAYLDFTGSGVETIAHIRENGRIVLMFCAFEGPTKIVRLHGQGEVVLPEDARYGGFLEHFRARPGIRAIIITHVTRVSDSCGFGVPLMDYVSDRDQLDKFSEQRGPEKLAEYRKRENVVSIDGLPGLDPAPGHA